MLAPLSATARSCRGVHRSLIVPPVVHRRFHLRLLQRLCPRHTSASRRAPLVWLVVAFPSAPASPTCSTSLRQLCICLAPRPSLFIMSRPFFVTLSIWPAIALPGASPPRPLSLQLHPLPPLVTLLLFVVAMMTPIGQASMTSTTLPWRRR